MDTGLHRFWKCTCGSVAAITHQNKLQIESRMDIHFRDMANFSDMNVQATGIAAKDRASGTRPDSYSVISSKGLSLVTTLRFEVEE